MKTDLAIWLSAFSRHAKEPLIISLLVTPDKIRFISCKSPNIEVTDDDLEDPSVDIRIKETLKADTNIDKDDTMSYFG